MNKRGYALIIVLITLLIIGYLVAKMMGTAGFTGQPGDNRGSPAPQVDSRPKQLVDKANATAQKASDRTAATEKTLKDLGLD